MPPQNRNAVTGETILENVPMVLINHLFAEHQQPYTFRCLIQRVGALHWCPPLNMQSMGKGMKFKYSEKHLKRSNLHF